MKTCVIYARVSTNMQDIDNSISAQIRICSEYAKKKNYSIIEIYTDEAESGTSTLKRAEFNRLIDNAKKKKFDIILADKTDRFSRNKEDCILAKIAIKKAGVELFFVTDNIQAGNEETFLQESLLETFAHWYKINLSKEVRKGQLQTLERGYNIGVVPFGYKLVKVKDGDREKSKLEINEDEACLVRRAFELSIEGKGYGFITDFLRSMGAKSRKADGSFRTQSTINLLKLEFYTGVKRYKDKIYTVPAIISKETFEKAKEKRKQRIGVRSVNKVKFPLIKSVFCSECGKKFTSDTSSVKKYRYYVCKSYRVNRLCTKLRVNADFLENKIKDLILEKLNEFKINPSPAKNEKTNLKKISEIDKQLKEIVRKKNNIIDSITEGLPASLFKEKLEQLTKSEENFKKEINLLSFQEPVKKIEAPDILNLINLIKGANPEELQNIYKDLIRVEFNIEKGEGKLFIKYVPEFQEPIPFEIQRVEVEYRGKYIRKKKS